MTAASQPAPRCIGEPISWLRLEQWALPIDAGGARATERAAIDAHLDACAACRACADELRADVVVLRPMVVPVRAPRRRWAWATWAAPAFAFAAAAVIALVLWRRGGGTGIDGGGDESIARIKGVGTVVVGTVRERAGAIRDDARTYLPGDRWKLVLTCPPGAAAWVEVSVVDRSAVPDYPLAPTRIACGNRVVVPGAFSITGTGDDRVCAHLGASELVPHGAATPADTACVTLHAETP